MLIFIKKSVGTPLCKVDIHMSKTLVKTVEKQGTVAPKRFNMKKCDRDKVVEQDILHQRCDLRFALKLIVKMV